jgi:hypothetical protein
MGYVGSYKDVIYPGPDREPRVLKYRVAFVDEGSPPATHAIIHLVQCDPKNPPPTHLNTALDLLLNKIVGTEFKGVRLDRLHFVLETESAFFEYPIEYSAEDFQKRGNPTVVKGTGKKQSIHIESRDVVGGSVPLFTLPDKRHSLNSMLAYVLR